MLTRSTIFENVWGYDFGPTSNALGVYMGYLRRKTEAGGEPRLLHTVRGVGLRAAGLSPGMPLRRRLADHRRRGGGVAILAASVVCYFVVRSQLRGQVDSALRAQSTAVERNGSAALAAASRDPGRAPAGRRRTSRSSLADGQRPSRGGDLALPVDRSAMRRDRGRQQHGTYLDGRPGRRQPPARADVPAQVTLGGQTGGAASSRARSTASTTSSRTCAWSCLVLLRRRASRWPRALGRLAARRVLAPLAEVAHTAEHIAETDDLTSRIHVHADDEVGQLATRFNAMLERLQSSRAALDDSVRAQRQLVADASHELRTPVTSLRTNIEVLLAGGELDPMRTATGCWPTSSSRARS